MAIFATLVRVRHMPLPPRPSAPNHKLLSWAAQSADIHSQKMRSEPLLNRRLNRIPNFLYNFSQCEFCSDAPHSLSSLVMRDSQFESQSNVAIWSTSLDALDMERMAISTRILLPKKFRVTLHIAKIHYLKKSAGDLAT